MSILSPLRDLIDRFRRPQRQTEIPYNLSKEELSSLKELTSSSQWKVYLSVVDKVCRLKVEGALISDNDNRWDRGFISGLRKAGLLPDEIIHSVERKNERRAERAAKRGRRNEERRKLATFGTGFWRGSNGGGS